MELDIPEEPAPPGPMRMILSLGSWISGVSPTPLLLFESWPGSADAHDGFPQPACVANHYYSVASMEDALATANGRSRWSSQLHDGVDFTLQHITQITNQKVLDQKDYIDSVRKRTLPLLAPRAGDSAAMSGTTPRGVAAFKYNLLHQDLIAVHVKNQEAAAKSDVASLKRKAEEALAPTIPKKKPTADDPPVLGYEPVSAPITMPPPPSSSVDEEYEQLMAPDLDDDASQTPPLDNTNAELTTLRADLEAATKEIEAFRTQMIAVNLRHKQAVARLEVLEKGPKMRPVPDQSAFLNASIDTNALARIEDTVAAIIRATFESGTLILLNYPIVEDETPAALSSAVKKLLSAIGLQNEANDITSVCRDHKSIRRSYAITIKFNDARAVEACIRREAFFTPEPWKDNPMGSEDRDTYDRLIQIQEEVNTSAKGASVHKQGIMFLRRQTRQAIPAHIYTYLVGLYQARNDHGRGGGGGGHDGGRGRGRGASGGASGGQRSQPAPPPVTGFQKKGF